MTQRVRSFFVLATLGALPLAAQSWDVVRGLQPGAHVKIEETAGTAHKGTVSAVTVDAISVQTGKTAVSVERTHVRRVQVESTGRRARNVAIGAAAGLAVGLAIDGTVGHYLRNESGDKGRPLYYVVPIGLFGGIGAALAPYKTIYRVK
jgi:hypothetical protein